MDLVILQPRSSAGYWWRDRLKQVLESAAAGCAWTCCPVCATASMNVATTIAGRQLPAHTWARSCWTDSNPGSRNHEILLALLCLTWCVGSAVAGELKAIAAKPAPALALHDLDGRPADLEHLRGRVVLVNFWAVWCPPCRKEMPSMARLEDKLKDRPFAILGVNVGESRMKSATSCAWCRCHSRSCWTARANA